MNAEVLRLTIAIPTLCVPTRKDPMCVAALKVSEEMVKRVQVDL